MQHKAPTRIPVPLVEEILLQETVKRKVIVSVLMWQLQRYKNLKDRVVQPYYAAFMSRVAGGGGGGGNGRFNDVQCLTSIFGQLILRGHLQMC